MSFQRHIRSRCAPPVQTAFVPSTEPCAGKSPSSSPKPGASEGIVSPVSPEKPFERTPLPGMSVRAGETKTAPNFHPATTIVTLPVDAEPSFLYHGRTRSYFPGGNGVSEVSRNSGGLSFSPGDVGVSDGCLEIRRKLVQTNAGPAYEYHVSFKKEIPGDRYQTGAWDPEKLAIRVNGKEYSLAPGSVVPPVHVPPPVQMPPKMNPPVPPFPSKDEEMFPKPSAGGPKAADPKGPAPVPKKGPQSDDPVMPAPPASPSFPPKVPVKDLSGFPALPPIVPDPDFPTIKPGGPKPMDVPPDKDAAFPKIPGGGPGLKPKGKVPLGWYD